MIKDIFKIIEEILDIYLEYVRQVKHSRYFVYQKGKFNIVIDKSIGKTTCSLFLYRTIYNEEQIFGFTRSTKGIMWFSLGGKEEFENKIVKESGKELLELLKFIKEDLKKKTKLEVIKEI